MEPAPQDEDMDPILETGFSFMDSRPEFAFSVRTLLNNTFDTRAPATQIADAICQQTDVGTFLVVENGELPEDAVVGFISLLDLGAETPVTQYLNSYLLEKCPQLREYANRRVGMLLSERVLNTPDELVPKLHSEMLKDVEWARSQRTGSYTFDYIVLCTRYCKLFTTTTAEPRKKKKSKAVQEEIVFLKPEEEDFLKFAEVHCSFQSESGDAAAASATSTQQYHFSDEQHTEKMVMLLSWTAYVTCVQALAQPQTA